MSTQSTGRSEHERHLPTKRFQFIDDELQLIRKSELAKLLRVNPWTIDQWRKLAKIPEPLILSPQIVAWRRSEILQWLDERQAKPAKVRRPNLKRRR